MTIVNTTGTRAGRVDWSKAKVPPAEIPESLPTPPSWLLVLPVGIVVVILVVIFKKKKAHQR